MNSTNSLTGNSLGAANNVNKNSLKNLLTLCDQIFIEQKNMPLNEFLNQEVEGKRIAEVFFSLEVDFIREVLFEKIILANDFCKENLDILIKAVGKDCIHGLWIKKIKLNTTAEEFKRVKQGIIENISSLYTFLMLKKEMPDINEWELIKKSDIEMPKFAYWLGMNIFSKYTKKNPQFFVRKAAIYKHLEQEAKNWEHIIEDSSLISKTVFPLLFFRDTKGKNEVKDFMKNHNIHIDINTKISYSDMQNNPVSIKEHLIRSGVFEFLEKEDKAKLTVYNYLFSDVRLKRYMKTKNIFLSLLNKEGEIFSNEKLNMIFETMIKKNTFFFPLHHSCFLDNGGIENKKINIFQDLKETNSPIFSILSRQHFIKAVFHKNPFIFNHLEVSLVFNLFKLFLTDSFLSEGKKILFNINGDDGQFLKMLDNLDKVQKNKLFNHIIKEVLQEFNESGGNKIFEAMGGVSVFIEVIGVLRGSLVIDDMTEFSNFKSAILQIQNNKSHKAVDIGVQQQNLKDMHDYDLLINMLDNIYLNNILEIKAGKKEKPLKV